jgi:DNA primase catalytic subunit
VPYKGLKMETDSKPEERSFKEKRVREITFIYYSRSDVKKAMFEFSKNRECVPRYFEGFGKRPDAFQYESDISEQVKKGATSFHCSEEIWSDPLEISTELSKKEFDELRIGWDLLLDVDSPYLEYSKIYTRLLINALRLHGLENFNIKFSGSKGFHLIVPWKAFPKEIYTQKTKDMFPEWPRIICQYLSELIQPKLTEEILKDDSLKQLAKKTGRQEEDLIVKECISCNRPVTKKYLITWTCPGCKNEIVTMDGLYNNRRKSKCPDCRKELIENSRKEIYSCEFCNINSRKNPEMFEQKERIATEKLIDADLILVAPRHLFRMPYSLHEKTALASIVLDKNKINDFQIKDANPLKAQVKDFYPIARENEAKELLLQALDWKEQKDKEEKMIQEKKDSINTALQISKPVNSNKKLGPGEYKKIEIANPTEDIYPPCIKILLKGIPGDGRKRALFLLINFFKSLGVSDAELEKRINEWNEKNPQPLKKGYIQSQLIWYKKSGARMPPNCDKTNYKDLAICKPDELCKQVKNPINYAVKKYFKSKTF